MKSRKIQVTSARLTGARVGSQQNLCSFKLASSVFASAQKRGEFGALGLAQLDPIATFICALHRRAPAETDMQEYFRVSPPWVHQMVLTLERAGFIRRQPGVARSIEVLVDPKYLPELL